ncbi:rod-binding protein [Ruegeria sp. HKCCD8929]|uniref:rod-binding protein n=1 Tax=Ruegeria sp. HKCCD8929 TaxID=2683006 RepID=UPI001489FB37|nr:rod-binding protein [Ruegeria sp. HKCCD8929]
MKIQPPSTVTAQPPPTPAKNEALRDAAVELEAAFLAEMLRSAGLGKTPEAFGGGAGEDQFASMLVRQQAEQLARAGGIGLSETLFNALMESGNAT